MARVYMFMQAFILGVFAFTGTSESSWQNIARQPYPNSPRPLAFVSYGIGRGALLVHDTLGALGAVCVLGPAALLLGYYAIRGQGSNG
jgi:hypothetical protein